MPTTAWYLRHHGLSPLTLVRTDTSVYLDRQIRDGAYAAEIRAHNLERIYNLVREDRARETMEDC